MLLLGASAVLAFSSTTDPAIEKRIDELLAKMTLEEKLGQMSQLSGVPQPLNENIKAQVRAGRWGSIFNAGSAKERGELQTIALKESRLGIPLIFGRDVIHGYRTIMPIPLGQAASWNPELVQQGARVAGLEASADGLHWTFAPMLDIARDPRWGRIAEGCGEDPYLTSVLGAAMVRGFQGSNVSSPDAIAACAKHYVGYGAAEGGRDYNTTWIPEILLRDVYLPPFKAALDAGAITVMSAFNDINGIPASGNAFTLRKILRDEWKFRGLVVSDWESMTEMINHGYASDATEVALKSLRAGVDMEMVSRTYFERLKGLLDSGAVDVKLIDDAVRNILRVKLMMGLFERTPLMSARTADISRPASLDTARRLASESLVLLQNKSSFLPLPKSVGKVAVIGPLADSPVDQMGSWVMDGVPGEVKTPLASLRLMLGNDRVVYARGMKNSRDLSHDLFSEALQAANQAEVILLFLGEEQIMSGEAHSRAFLDLPGAQQALVREIAGTGKPIVGIILAGRPLTFASLAESAQAIVYAWHPGTMGGPAIAELLFGDTAPAGRLPVSFPRTVGQVPLYYSHKNTGRPPSPNELGIPMGTVVDPRGFNSKYIDVDYTPAYPFGFGLSYTTFEYSNLRLSTESMTANGALEVSADIKNTGKRAGSEVVQIYVRDRFGSVTRPVKELKGFQKVSLAPGEIKTVTFKLTGEDLSFHDETMKRVTEPGKFNVWIAPDAASGPMKEFEVR